MANLNPQKFFSEVRSESKKIVWPTRKATVQSAVMVVIMTTLLAVFFLGTDSAFKAIVKGLLGLLS